MHRSRYIPVQYHNQCNLFASGMDVVEVGLKLLSDSKYQSDYRIYLDMPSFKQESIRILVQKGGLRIEGKRQLFYEGCKKVLSQHRFTGNYNLYIPVEFGEKVQCSLIVTWLAQRMQLQLLSMESFVSS